MNNKHNQSQVRSTKTHQSPCYELAYILKDNSCKVASEKYWTRRSAELQGKQALKRNKNIVGVHVRYYEETFNVTRGVIETIISTVAILDLEGGTWIEK